MTLYDGSYSSDLNQSECQFLKFMMSLFYVPRSMYRSIQFHLERVTTASCNAE